MNVELSITVQSHASCMSCEVRVGGLDSSICDVKLLEAAELVLAQEREGRGAKASNDCRGAIPFSGLLLGGREEGGGPECGGPSMSEPWG